MQIKKILLLGYLCVHFFSTYSQQTASISISGTIKDIAGKGIDGATIYISNGGGAYTNEAGVYKLIQVKSGEQEITVSALGYDRQIKSIIVEPNRDIVLDFVLNESVNEMEEVSIIGRTENQEVNRQAYNVTAIDAKSLYNTTLDLSHALDRVSGVRIRESGGVGSSFNFSLNGFSGNQVRFFLDGIPMDNFGSSFQINNIPVNFAERVEVYKGVVPIWLGSDALGGAVNIITGNRGKNYIDASYSYGSFNTHRSAVNAAITDKSGLTFQLNAFQNYSDNNYWVTLDVADINTGRYYPDQKVKRFHDNYHNETLIANVGVVGKSYADKLLLGITLGQNYNEVQTGARMTSVFGAWHRRGSIVMPTLKYQKKDLLLKGLDVTINANYNLGYEQNIDTAFRRYDWFGNYKEYEGAGSERSRSMYRWKNNNGLVTSTLAYQINKQHSIAFNNVFSTFNRKGSDELYPDEQRYQQPRKTNKDILGVGYKFELDDRWSSTVFGKYLTQNSVQSLANNPGNGEAITYIEQRNNVNRFGFGLATSYFLNTQFQIKASFEKSNRLPENEEMFGDLINQENNFNLKPETSNNINLGFNYLFKVADQHHFNVAANAIYRRANDFIYYRLNNNQSMLVADNLEGVSNIGGDAEIRYSFKNLFTAGVNFTYQDIRNLRKYEPGYTDISPVYKDRMPNLPFMFGNADASIFLTDFGKQGNNLSVGYNLLYVHAYYLYWPSRGQREGKYDIPKQLAHDANIMYTLQNGRYNIAFECKNLTDAKLYDNFSLQKPSRGYYLKLRYFISRQY